MRRVKLLTHTFKGPRFEQHGIDVDALQELITLKAILLETAEYLWRREHPEKERLPKGFSASFNLELTAIKPGSAVAVLERSIEEDNDSLFYDEEIEREPDELDQAIIVFTKTISAAKEERALPEEFPKTAISKFNEYGRTLLDNESLEIKADFTETPSIVIFDKDIRKRLLERQPQEYFDTMPITGEIRLADLDGCKFRLKLKDGSKIEGQFSREKEQMITSALYQHETQRIRIIARVVLDSFSGKIKRITEVFDYYLDDPEEEKTLYSPSIWALAKEIRDSTPIDEWECIPKSASVNLDSYLYPTHEDEK